MTVRIHAQKLGLDVPSYSHADSGDGGWFSTLVSAARSGMRRELRTLLEDVDFCLEEGERLALLGANGAGKTTLLRVLAGSLSPTRGRLEISGSCKALLNLGLGFNPEATVRENVYLRGTAMGIRPEQIRQLIEPILSFAELGHVGNQRLATLSSGQRMRLGFSVSTSVQHDIMLLDEWFGAGDFSFVEKARARMSDRVEGSKIVVLASHSFTMLRRICTRGLVMHQGRVAYQGDVEGAIAAYKRIYQSTEQYQAERQGVETEVQRLVSSKLRTLEKERRLALRQELAISRRERAAALEEYRKMKEEWREKRDEMRALCQRLEAKVARQGDD